MEVKVSKKHADDVWRRPGARGCAAALLPSLVYLDPKQLKKAAENEGRQFAREPRDSWG